MGVVTPLVQLTQFKATRAVVIPGLVPGIQQPQCASRKQLPQPHGKEQADAWIPGIKPGMTILRARVDKRPALFRSGEALASFARECRRSASNVSDLKSLIRTIPDYPKKGIMFRDVTTLLGDARGFSTAIERMAAPYMSAGVQGVAGIEARGFILGGAIADKLGCGFVPFRKKGKLPWKTIGQEYTLEYCVDIIEMHEDAIRRDERILIVDDLIATGGTAEAAVKLVQRSGGEIVGATFIIDLPELGGMRKLSSLGVEGHALVAFEGH
jgi:adenine phosphoribosyltransferase